MSSHVKLHLGSNVLAMVNSPARRNPNNPTHIAAHSITSLNSVESAGLDTSEDVRCNGKSGRRLGCMALCVCSL